MILIKPSYEILTKIDWLTIIKNIEAFGRTCYKSNTSSSLEKITVFIKKLIENGHHSVLEHENISIRFICDRGISHEIVRHRLAAYSQESTRYCNYKGGVTFIIPPWIDIEPGEYTNPLNSHDIWFNSMYQAELNYQILLISGWSPQQARVILPNSLKTEIVMTANLREWRHVLKLRTSKTAHPQMQELMIPLLQELKSHIPVIFDDI